MSDKSARTPFFKYSYPTTPTGDRLIYTVEPPAHGTLAGTPPNLTYLPATNFHGADTFSFRVSDGIANSLPAEIRITVLPVNDAPFAIMSVSPLAEFPHLTNLIVIATNGIDAAVSLDGSGSWDVDTQPLLFGWFIGTTWLAGEPVVDSTLPVGSHEITLVVNDGQASGTNATAVEVISNCQALAVLFDLVQNSAQLKRAAKQLLPGLKQKIRTV